MLFVVGSEFAIALGLLVAVLDLIPLAGATLAAIIVSTVIVIETGLVYGRTVQLSPLTVLCAVLVGAQLAGILGALLAIPVAGSLLAVGREILQYREETADGPAQPI